MTDAVPDLTPRMVTVKMLAGHTGSPDGRTVVQYEEGQTYTIPEDLARVFVDEIGCAHEIKADGGEVPGPVRVVEAPVEQVDESQPVDAAFDAAAQGQPEEHEPSAEEEAAEQAAPQVVDEPAPAAKKAPAKRASRSRKAAK